MGKITVELRDKPAAPYVRRLDHDPSFTNILLWQGGYYAYREDLSNSKLLIYVHIADEIKEVF